MSRRPLLQRLDLPSVVVFRALHLGAMLCAVPAMRALRAALPRTHVALVGLPWARQFADRFSRYVDEFIPFPGHPLLPEQDVPRDGLVDFYAGLCARRFGLAIQLHGGAEAGNEVVSGFGARATAGFCRGRTVVRERSMLLPFPDTGAEPERLQRLMTRLGAAPAGDEFEFPLTREDEEALDASGVGAGLVPGNYLCLHPGARRRDTCWPARCFAEVGDRLAGEFGLRIVLTGSAEEADLGAEVAAQMRHPPVDATGRLPLGALAVLLRGARLLVCNDTGVSHIAAGLKLKSVVIFGQDDVARWAPPDRLLHRCIWDPSAQRIECVLRHARVLLSDLPASRQRSMGMWPYW